MFPGLRCPCPKARLPVQGWHRSAKRDKVGRTAAGERDWGVCLVTVGWAGAGVFFPQPPNLLSLSAPPGLHSLAQSWSPWGGMLPRRHAVSGSISPWHV